MEQRVQALPAMGKIRAFGSVFSPSWVKIRTSNTVIPSSRSRSQAIPYDKHLYEERNLVERFINKIKHYRRIATRYEKTALSFVSMLFLVGAMIWLR
jgi:transposase